MNFKAGSVWFGVTNEGAPSASGQHNVQVGDPLPDTLSSLLIGYPYGYTIAVAPPYASNGAHIVHREHGLNAALSIDGKLLGEIRLPVHVGHSARS